MFLAHLLYSLDVSLTPHQDSPFNGFLPRHGDVRVNVNGMVVARPSRRLKLIKPATMLLLFDGFTISMNVVLLKLANWFQLMRSQSPIYMAMTLLLSLQLVLLRAQKKGFPRFIGYPNFINDLTKLVSSQTLAHVQLRICLKC